MDHMHGGGDDDHQHGGEMEGGMDCPMQMVFHAGHCEQILWKGWTVSNIGSFFLSTLAIFLIAVGYEALKYLREKLYYSVATTGADEIAARLRATGPNGSCCTNIPIQNKTFRQRIINSSHLLQTALHLIQVALSYFLMLVVMTYNYWLCLAIILGAAAGYFCFGWIKQQSVDFNEHCH